MCFISAVPRDTLQLAERPCPQWPLARIQHHLYVDTSNLAVIRELAELPLLAPLLRNLFAQRLQREQTEDWQSRLGQEGVTAAHVIAQARAEGRLPLRVERIQYETARIKSILLASIDGSALPPAPAGGHLQLYLPGGRMRQYSLCPTGDDHSYAIAVALEADGRGGSRWLHETLQEGDVIATSLPQDSYPPANGNGLHVMFAGGIGITPFLSMIAHFRRSGQRYRLYYTCRRPEEAAFVDALRALCGTDLNLHVSGEGRGRLDLPAIVAALPEDAHVYCCGPQAMVSALQQAMPGSAKQRLHVEAFAPPAASGQHDGYRVTLASSGRQLDVAPGQRLLDALRNGGVEVPSSCETGNCGSCVMRYSEGHAMHFDTCLTDATRASFLAACVSHAISPSITLAL
ncbi:PDR/VanB family oxidoreductase [Herbaspirillum huttiense]|uniref:PDR/VanB family oxidoreductase n=1 Tax=Herbaspirillum huttiense TaxID=863372 RepID=UPI0039B0DD9F